MSTFTAAVGFGSNQQLQDLLELTPDPYFPDHGPTKKIQSFLKISDSSKPDLVLEKLTKLNLDLTRISNRILVMGRCWNYRTDREACRNNIEEAACFLNARYERSYLILNFGSPDMKYDISPFRNQVVSFPVSKILALTVKMLFDACRSITAWLRMSKDNVVVIQCKNGKSRSGLVVACLLRYSGLFDSAHESLEYFRSKRSPNDQTWVSVTLKRYLRYFNDILILDGRVPSSVPLKLHQVILTTIPDFNGSGGCNPGIEVFQEGRLVYSSAIRLAAANHENLKPAEDDEFDEELLREFKISLVLNPNKFDKSYNPLVLMDDYNIIFRLENISLERDVQIRVYHHNEQAGHNVTIFNLAFNTGFMSPGIIRLRTSDLEISSDVGKAARFDPEFAVDLVITPNEESKDVIGYVSSVQRSLVKDLMKLSQIHSVRADPLLAKPLELQGHRKFFVKLALQLGNNDIHAAHEFLSYLSKSPLYPSLDRELTELTRAQHEATLAKTQDVKAILSESKSKSSETLTETAEPKAEKTVNPILEALKTRKTLEVPGESSGGLPFLAGLMKATADRKLQGQLDISNDLEKARTDDKQEKVQKAKEETVPVKKPNGPMGGAGGLPFLAGLMKATANKRSEGSLESVTSDDKLDEASKENGEPPSDKIGLAKVNPNPPPAPPLPDYLRHGERTSYSSPTSSDATSRPAPPPMPAFLQAIKKRSESPQTESDLPSAPSLPKLAPSIPEKSQKIKNKLHWGEIRGEEKIRNTIWSELQDASIDETEKSYDVLKFEELFCVNPSEEARQARKNTDSVQAETSKNDPKILDSRRANNVGIGLSRFYKRMTNAEIVNAIVYQKHLLDINDLMCLKAILPTEDERQRLSLFQGDSKTLIPSEAFMLEISRVPCIDWMIDSLIFESTFPGECESIASRLSLMTAVLVKIRECPMLKSLFRLVLELGNLANYDYGRVPAHMRIRGKALGFTMDSLLKLHEVKSVDRKSSLMNYLLMIVQEKTPELLGLPGDFSDISTIKHWDSAALLIELETLKSSLNKVANLKTTEESTLVDSFRESHTGFLELAKPKLEKLAKLGDGLRKAWSETASYLGEDPEDKRPEELLIVFDQFFRQFKEAHDQNVRAAKLSSKSASNISLKMRNSGSASSSGASSNIPSRSSSPVVSEIRTDTTILDLDNQNI